MHHPDFNKVKIPEQYLIDNIEFAKIIASDFDHAKEMNASWYGPKKSFLITKPMLHTNGFMAKKILSTHGGYRKGSGRKPKEPTKVVRVPVRLLEKFKEFLKTNKI